MINGPPVNAGYHHNCDDFDMWPKLYQNQLQKAKTTRHTPLMSINVRGSF